MSAKKHNDAAVQIAELFKAMSDPTRLRILYAVGKSELGVSDLAERIGMSQTSVSHHLGKLRNQQLVTTRRAGREIFYSLAERSITEILDAAKRHVEAQ